MLNGFNISDYIGADGLGMQEAKSEAKDSLAAFDEIIKSYELSAMQQTLACYVEDRFEEARQARKADGVDDEMERSTNAYNNRYNPEDMEMVAETSDVYAPMTNTKCRGLQNWIMDILANAEDKPWTLSPTPDPELPPWMEEEIVKRLELEVMQHGVSPDIQDAAREYKELAKKHAKDIATERTRAMEDRIYDQMLKSDWRDQFRQFVDDISYMPAAVMHGPTVEMRTTLKWNGTTTVEKQEPTYVLRRVNPPDFYPAPGATTTQDAAFLCEVRPYSASQLMQSLNLFGVDQSAVRKLIALNPDGYTISETRPGEGRAPGVQHTTGPARTYETILYTGAVDGSVLIEHGFTDVDPQGVEEMELWVCNGLVLRALRNPYPLKRRPYNSACFLRRAGRFWGRTLPALLKDIQRIVNGSLRGLVRDMAYSSGPIGEYDIERMVAEDRVDEFSPFKLYAVKPDYTQGGASAIRFQRLPSNMQQFIYTYDRYMKEADDVSGIPAYVIGNPNVAGAGRTLGGLSLLMGNAAKGVKRVISDIDKDMIEPIIESFYNLNMVYSPDESIKADAKVIARGATGLLQRELSQSRAAEVLPLLLNGLQLGVVQPSSIATLMREILVSLGFDPGLVDDPEREQQIAMMLAAQGGQGMGITAQIPGAAQPGLPPVSPNVSLDGRSALPPDPSALEVV